MTSAADFLRMAGLTEEAITKMQAELDQATAEADHLIEHAKCLTTGSIPHAAFQGMLIRGHLEALSDEKKHAVLPAVLVRAGELAAAVEQLNTENRRLEADLRASREAHA
ncbi:hypothetical protein [Microbacterium maritypicum]